MEEIQSLLHGQPAVTGSYRTAMYFSRTKFCPQLVLHQNAPTPKVSVMPDAGHELLHVDDQA